MYPMLNNIFKFYSDNNERSPLLLAAGAGHERIVQDLLQLVNSLSVIFSESYIL